MSVVPLHLLLDFEVLVGHGLADVLSLHREHAFQSFLLRSEHLHLFLVVLEFISQLQNHLLKS